MTSEEYIEQSKHYKNVMKSIGTLTEIKNIDAKTFRKTVDHVKSLVTEMIMLTFDDGKLAALDEVSCMFKEFGWMKEQKND